MTTIDQPSRGARRTMFLAATLLASLLLAPAANAAQFFLENPTPGSFRSGVSVLSGWACDAETIEIELVGTESTETVQASYGTPRLDTATPDNCGVGDSDNGFGALTNLNRLGTGPATATLKIDGVAVETNEFTVVKPTTLNFNPMLDGAYTLPGFPGDGEAVDVVWTTSTQGFGMAPAGSSPATAAAGAGECASDFATKCNLENPSIAQFVSGIIVFSGWICDVTDSVRLVLTGVDATETIFPSYGTDRADTETACGDSNNGLGALSNVNRLGHGPATVELFIDDVLAVSYSFFVTKPSDANFLPDASGEYVLPGFPTAGQDTTVIWQRGDQNFSIKEVTTTAGATPTPVPGSIPTPGVTPTPSPVPTETPDGPTPTPDGSEPTPTPDGGGPVCGNGIVEEGEQCDGDQFDIFLETCEDAYVGLDGCTGDLLCASDCTVDGSLCSCPCEEDFDCDLPDGVLIDCGPLYCNTDFCDPLDVPFCECAIGENEDVVGDIEGACLGSNLNLGTLGLCITSPFDPGENDSLLNALCTGLDGAEPDTPRCDYCFEF